jgi:hypothetical protein
LQDKIVTVGLAGEVKSVDANKDYLLWVDANLAALKTDHAIKRQLAYFVTRAPAGASSTSEQYLASAVMTYTHQGSFDWRTTRYQDYARIFVPEGSQLIKVTGNTPVYNSKKMPTVDQGEENGKKWFGTFISIEPGKTAKLSFTYVLPSSIASQIDNGTYQLLLQKQAGTVGVDLTLGLDFGKKLISAWPAEAKDRWGDKRYDWGGSFGEDKEFVAKF